VRELERQSISAERMRPIDAIGAAVSAGAPDRVDGRSLPVGTIWLGVRRRRLVCIGEVVRLMSRRSGRWRLHPVSLDDADTDYGREQDDNREDESAPARRVCHGPTASWMTSETK
jgi:hypothetical protein